MLLNKKEKKNKNMYVQVLYSQSSNFDLQIYMSLIIYYFFLLLKP